MKKHEEKERKMKFGQTREDSIGDESEVVDRKEVQSLSSPPLTVADSMIHLLIYIHATMYELTRALE